MIIKILKDIGLLSLVIVALGAVGIAISSYIPWVYFTYFFAIMRNTTEILDVILNMTAVWAAFGLTLLLETFLWGFKGAMVVIYWFKKY